MDSLLAIRLKLGDMHRILSLKSLTTIELSSNSMELVVGSWSPMDFRWLFCKQFQQLLSSSGACLDVVFKFE